METWEKVLNGNIIEYSQFRNIQTMKLSNIYLNFTFKYTVRVKVYVSAERRPGLSWDKSDQKETNNRVE